ncbi:MAG: hypothetical protein JWM10_4509 [Myxococcaceae bacterium]|nr:hypothetical protein [Myxococcaceae bacterium]
MRVVASPPTLVFSNVVRFLALIGALVFVHELGHFAWAKAYGIKVLKFSLGFGPRVFGIRYGETDYCIGLVPFGGFVKMLGEDPSDEIPHEDLGRAFHAQSLARRFVVVLAGPVMSLLFPVLLYFVALLGRSDLTAPLIGTVAPGYPAAGVLLPGDRVTAIDGESVNSFEQVREAIVRSPRRSIRFDLERGGQPVGVRVTPEAVTTKLPFDERVTTGFLGIAPGFPLPVVGVRSPSPAHTAGLRTFDVVTMYRGAPVRRWSDLEASLTRSRGSTVPLAFLRPRAIEGALGGLVDLEVFDPGLAQIAPEPGTGEMTTRTGIEASDLYLSDVAPDSPEGLMGLRRGARVLALDGEVPPSWERFIAALTEGPPRLRTIRFALDHHEAVGGFSLRPVVLTDEFGDRSVQLRTSLERWRPIVAEPPLPNPSPVRYALSGALTETAEAMRFLGLGIVRMLQGRVPVTSVGGPIAIYDASRSVAVDGVWGFFRLMALISLNLGLLNLLPVPTLDGGHLLFFGIEAVTRRPVPLRVRQVASVLGLLLVVAVMVVAFRNDLERKLGVDFRVGALAPAAGPPGVESPAG